MSILDYFSKDKSIRAKFIFNSIAPLYSRFDKTLQSGFERSTGILDKEIIITGKSVLDVGTGTGAWGATINKMGPSKVVGVDFSEKMLKLAKKKHPYMDFTKATAENLENIEDDSFDIVTASFVLHGPDQTGRKRILKELKRVSKKYVVLHDMLGKTPIFIRFLEFLEQSDYKNFKLHFPDELKEEFPKTKNIPVKYGAGLYIAEK